MTASGDNDSQWYWRCEERIPSVEPREDYKSDIESEIKTETDRSSVSEISEHLGDRDGDKDALEVSKVMDYSVSDTSWSDKYSSVSEKDSQSHITHTDYSRIADSFSGSRAFYSRSSRSHSVAETIMPSQVLKRRWPRCVREAPVQTQPDGLAFTWSAVQTQPDGLAFTWSAVQTQPDGLAFTWSAVQTQPEGLASPGQRCRPNQTDWPSPGQRCRPNQTDWPSPGQRCRPNQTDWPLPGQRCRPNQTDWPLPGQRCRPNQTDWPSPGMAALGRRLGWPMWMKPEASHRQCRGRGGCVFTARVQMIEAEFSLIKKTIKAYNKITQLSLKLLK
ncbi:uncharacterized protein [Salmo salar]|uniref:Uncharacterized protein LOC106613998 n=1 Tax=Salmo salar TaxID=8030 RepID=A0A1S3T6Z8_SALSA|nr:uncharacterized protein LOC106613998 [Salmo salar]XP_045543409.1 uncharacterized protein LOC106613998 [Salmo salar]|eukprot:XP_014072369.1 PREDICTED: uncharacterized protein LOC106613998 [Salmo salar]